MSMSSSEEFESCLGFLPAGWEEQAAETGAFRRTRFLKSPSQLLRLLLLRAVTDGGLRMTATMAKESGVASMSAVALLKRCRASVEWLQWIASAMARQFRDSSSRFGNRKVRLLDSTTVSGPASKGTDWRLQYSIELDSLACDWHALTDSSKGDSLEYVAVDKNDILVADRAYLGQKGIRHVKRRGGDVVVRVRWQYGQFIDDAGKTVDPLRYCRKLRVGEIGEWPVELPGSGGTKAVKGRIIAVKLPAPLVAKQLHRIRRSASKRGNRVDPRTLEAAHYVALFTTLPAEELSAEQVLELYRLRWQVEIVFKRHKQILKLGKLPHNDPRAAKSWLLAKLVVALLLESLYRSASLFSPWGYRIKPTSPAHN